MVGLSGIPFTSVFNACATAASAAKACADGIRLGDYDIGIAIGLDKHPRGAFTEDPAWWGCRAGKPRTGSTSRPSSSA
jgi:acetyl-CoA acetyltransferase